MAQPGTAPTHARPTRSTERVGMRLTAMTAAIFLLATLAVLIRSKLAPDPATAQTAAARLAAPASALLALVDTRREQAGCAALKVNGALTATAQNHVTDMVAKGYVGQMGPDGQGPQQRAAAVGYQGAVAEILAAGIPTPAQVLAQWTNPANPASAAVMAKMTDCTRLSAGVGYSSGRAMRTFEPGVWVVDLGDQ